MLSGTTEPSNSDRIQSLQLIILRKITDALSYVSNYVILDDRDVRFLKVDVTSTHPLLTRNPYELSSLSLTNIPPSGAACTAIVRARLYRDKVLELSALRPEARWEYDVPVR